MKTKAFKNILLIFVVLSMLFSTMTGLFLATKHSSYAAVDVENQNNLTNHANVTFDAYFIDSSDNQSHSIVADVNPEYPYLTIDMGVTDGTLINPTVQFLDLSNTTDINYELPFSNMTENIQSVDETNKKIVFSDIENLSTSQHMINRRRMQVYAKFSENVEISKLNETTKVIFSATYIDSSGNISNISKEIYLNIGWTANLTMDLAQRVTKYVSNNDGSGKSVTLETTINAKIVSNGKNNILPVQSTNIVVDVPTYEGIAPSNVQVTANKTVATNGNDETEVVFDNSNWSYDSSTGQITINVTNPVNSGSVACVRGSDEYVITYTYPEAAYDLIDLTGVDILSKLSGTMTLYSNTSTVDISDSVNETITLTNYVGTQTGSLPKSLMYTNTLGTYLNDITYRYNYRIWIEELGNMHSTRIEFNQVQFNAGSSTYPSFISGVNYAPITDVLIDVDSFATVLGDTGSIKIYDDDYNLIDTITTSTATTTEDSIVYYTVTLPESTRTASEKITLEISTPVGSYVTLNTRIKRQISSSLPYTIPELQTFTSQSEDVKTYDSTNDDPTNFEYDSFITVPFDYPATDTNATLNVEDTVLAPTGEAQSITLNIVLDNSRMDTDLWSNPTFDIELPEYITDMANTIHIAENSSDLAVVKESLQKGTIDGKIHLLFQLEGTQKAIYSTKTSIKLTFDVTVDRFTPTISEDVNLYYLNDLASNYTNPGTWILSASSEECGVSNAPIDFIAEPTLLCVAQLSNFNEAGDVLDSSFTTSAEIEPEPVEPTMTIIAQNNHTVPVSDLCILGRIPYTNNKSAISNVDLGTNVNTAMTGLLTQVSPKPSAGYVTIYYSDNLDATTDLSLATNNWTTTPVNFADIRSYMIVVNDYELAVGEQIKFEYVFSTPADIAYNNSLYVNFGAYYTYNSTTTSTETTKIGLTTGEGPNLRVVKESSIEEGATVKEGDLITYTITVYNDGDVAAKNVVIKDTVPANTTYIAEDGTEKPSSTPISSEVREVLEAGDSYSISFTVRVDEIANDGTTISNTATVSANDIPDTSSNTVGITANTTPVLTPNLRVVKESSIENGATVKQGDLITYTITVYNDGDGPAKNVVIKDTVPTNTTYIAEDGTENSSIKSITSAVRETLGAGEHFSMSFTVKVDEIANDGTTISNTATVSADEVTDISSNTVGITANTTPILTPNLRVVKKSSIENGATVKEGDLITYTITVYNDGTGPAKNVVIRDTVPTNTTYIAEDGTENSSIKSITSAVRKTLEAGEHFSMSFTVKVNKIANDGTTISNTATVSADDVTDTSSNTVGITANTTPDPEPQPEPQPEPEPEPEPEPDDTTSTKPIPDTGKYTLLTILIISSLGMLLLGFVGYKKFKIS